MLGIPRLAGWRQHNPSELTPTPLLRHHFRFDASVTWVFCRVSPVTLGDSGMTLKRTLASLTSLTRIISGTTNFVNTNSHFVTRFRQSFFASEDHQKRDARTELKKTPLIQEVCANLCHIYVSKARLWIFFQLLAFFFLQTLVFHTYLARIVTVCALKRQILRPILTPTISR